MSSARLILSRVPRHVPVAAVGPARGRIGSASFATSSRVYDESAEQKAKQAASEVRPLPNLYRGLGIAAVRSG